MSASDWGKNSLAQLHKGGEAPLGEPPRCREKAHTGPYPSAPPRMGPAAGSQATRLCFRDETRRNLSRPASPLPEFPRGLLVRRAYTRRSWRFRWHGLPRRLRGKQRSAGRPFRRRARQSARRRSVLVAVSPRESESSSQRVSWHPTNSVPLHDVRFQFGQKFSHPRSLRGGGVTGGTRGLPLPREGSGGPIEPKCPKCPPKADTTPGA